jgi:hypothetical protein
LSYEKKKTAVAAVYKEDAAPRHSSSQKFLLDWETAQIANALMLTAFCLYRMLKIWERSMLRQRLMMMMSKIPKESRQPRRQQLIGYVKLQSCSYCRPN